MKDKSRIDVYNTIYNVDIVVANKYTKLEQLQQDYCFSNDEELNEDILNPCATCSICKNKHTNMSCCLIKDNHNLDVKNIDKFLDTIETIAHESMHAFIDIYNYVDAAAQYNNPEPDCYFIAYIARCVAKTIFNR